MKLLKIKKSLSLGAQGCKFLTWTPWTSTYNYGALTHIKIWERNGQNEPRWPYSPSNVSK